MNHRDKIAIQKIISELDIAEELVQAITKDTRDKYKQIAWREAAGFRDIAAHKYQTLNMDDVYTTVKQDFPYFRKQLISLLN